jgi:two-component system cell cycle sensor histidine kinase/response regulator CckA
MQEMDKLSVNRETYFMRILIVDDELVSRKKLREIMDAFGQCIMVENGTDALRVATSQNPPDLILLDIIMPGMDGYEVCKRLKADRKTSNIPVIFISSRSEEEDEAQGLGLGAVDYITKPFSPAIINARVRTHLELKKHRNRLEELVNERTAELKKATKEMQAEITERKQAEEALRVSEERYRLLVENADDAIFIAQDEVIKFANPKTEELTGYSAEKLSKTPFANFVHPEDRNMVVERHKRSLEGEELSSAYSFRIINSANEEFWGELNAALITWEGRPAILNFLRDITPQKKLEAQLQQAQKMESLGNLAGGVAHDFNNLLMAIQGRTSIMLRHKDSSHPDFGHLSGIGDYVKNAADLTEQLLGFARAGKYEVRPTDINDLIKKSSTLFGRTKKEIAIHSKYQEDVWTLEVDRGQIDQVLLNLFVNAWHAMPGGGDLFTETENVTVDDRFIRPFEVQSGKYVKISITDTGVGMDEATRRRIFEPFFTTRKMGRGTGIGLASVYGIIKNHEGFIDVYSEKGHGTAFKIYLPASEKEAMTEKALAEDIVKGSEGVLLVDDEDMIIDVGKELLGELGYEVLLAGSGQEAIRIYEENEEKIDMVILDMIMPDMSGGDTYDRLKEINPEIKVLLSSGYSINGQATEILNRGCDGFIQKPFNMKQLSQKLREVLDKK